MPEFVDYSISGDLTERIGSRVWKHETGSIHKGIGEIRLLHEHLSSMAMSGLATAIKEHIRLNGYATQKDVDVLLDSHLTTLLGMDADGEET
jgi:hypothetical protein